MLNSTDRYKIKCIDTWENCALFAWFFYCSVALVSWFDAFQRRRSFIWISNGSEIRANCEFWRNIRKKNMFLSRSRIRRENVEKTKNLWKMVKLAKKRKSLKKMEKRKKLRNRKRLKKRWKMGENSKEIATIWKKGAK